MSRLNFIVKVPAIPRRPRIRKKLKNKESKQNSGNTVLEPIQEIKNSETRRSSYYSVKSDSSDSNLIVLETYDEFLNLRDIDNILWKNSDNGFLSEETDQSKSKINLNEGTFLLKQICTNLKCPLDVISSQKEYEITPLFQTERAKFRNCDIKTAIIAQRILDTQEQIEKTKKNSRTGISKDSLIRNSFNKGKSISSMKTITEFPCSSTAFNQSLSKTLSNLTSKYGLNRSKVHTCEYEIQVDLIKKEERPISHSCNTQTEPLVTDAINEPKYVNSKITQTIRKTRNQYAQTLIITCQDKFINTDTSFCPNQERFTQMYEHITENDLLCMEWIDKNLFRVPVNPDTVVVDEKIKDSSEFTCMGTSFFEQELNWERQALCL